MKKYKLLLSISVLATGTVAPVISLASCTAKTDTIKAIPEQMLDIQGDILYGLNKTAVLDAYDTLVIPDNIVAISAEAFKDAFSEDTTNSCPIKTIVFNKNLMSIGASAFANCDSITRIDMSALQDIKLMALRLGTESGKQSFASTKNSGGKAVLPEGLTDLQFKWIEERFVSAGLAKSWFEGQPEEEANVDKVNAIIAGKGYKTLSQVYEACKDQIDIETITAEQNHKYVWDQKENVFALVEEDPETKAWTLAYGPSGYTLNTNSWQLWEMVSEDDFNEYNQHSQYLKKPTETNGLEKTTYSFISGFDCSQNTDVKNVHYFYEKMDTQTAKDIIINTSSNKTNVDVSAWAGTGTAGTGDTVTHYGQMCELTVVSNDKYIENGNTISATVYDGEIKVDADANIVMTYVRDASVTLIDYKTTGTIDKIYTETQEIKTAIESQVPGAIITVQDESTYQTTKETEISSEGGEVQHVFTVTGGAQNVYYESFSAVAAASNDADNPEYFEGKTITLNKDYDMSIESANWVSICNTDDSTGVKAFKGTIDGNGHTILNFNLNATSGNPGLINANAGSVKNLNFKNCSLNNTGGRICLVAVWNGAGNMEFSNLNFYNCNVTSTKSNGFAFGYILNSGTSATFKNIYADDECWAKGSGSGVVQTGFLSQACDGVNSLTFENCELHLKVDSYYASGAYVGQLGGVHDNGVITTTFKNCTTYGDIIVSQGTSGNGPMVGGFIGARQNNTLATYVNTTTTFDECTNYSKVYAADQFVNVDSLGGFIGYGNNPYAAGSTVEFIDCTNEGEIGKENTGTSYIPNHAGGFFGRTNANENLAVTFTRCKNKGYINASTAGHFMGLIDQTTEASLATKKCVDCSITGSLRDQATRIKITGEPDPESERFN